MPFEISLRTKDGFLPKVEPCSSFELIRDALVNPIKFGNQGKIGDVGLSVGESGGQSGLNLLDFCFPITADGIVLFYLSESQNCRFIWQTKSLGEERQFIAEDQGGGYHVLSANNLIDLAEAEKIAKVFFEKGEVEIDERWVPYVYTPDGSEHSQIVEQFESRKGNA